MSLYLNQEWNIKLSCTAPFLFTSRLVAICQVYLLSGIRNNTLLEYVSLQSFAERTPAPPAKVVQLPFHWQGTGHVVYNGFLYCHKADTPNQILKVCD